MPPRPQARLAMPWSAISIATVAGALLGTALTYSAVRLVPLPDARPQIADPAPRLDALATVLDRVSQRLDAVEEQGRTTSAGLQSTSEALTAGLSAAKAAIADMPVPAVVDLGPTDQRIGALETQIAALGAGASSPDASALTAKVTELDQRLLSLETRPAAAVAPSADLAALKAEVETLKQALAARAPSLAEGEVSAAVRLPLLVSALDSAFAFGRPFAGELASLKPLLPTLMVPDALAAAAETGLPAPASVAARVSAAVPDMLAKRGNAASGDVVQDGLDWLKGLVALRPAGDVPGDTPEALVARLETAAARGDWATSSALFSQLPEPMRLAAGPVAADVANLAAAQDFIGALRRDALAPAAETSP